MYDVEKANKAIRFIELLSHTGDFHGVPFSPLDWQRKIITDVFGTINERGVRQFRTGYIETPKKNGKSEFVAAMALLHLFSKEEPNGEIYGCAGDRSQAAIIFDTCVEMIMQEPELEKRVKYATVTSRLRIFKRGQNTKCFRVSLTQSTDTAQVLFYLTNCIHNPTVTYGTR